MDRSNISLKPHVDSIDKAVAINTLHSAVRHSSITGNEATFAAYLAEILNELGMDQVILRDFLPGRPNVTGT